MLLLLAAAGAAAQQAPGAPLAPPLTLVAAHGFAQETPSERTLGVVVVTTTAPSSLPTDITTTTENITGAQVQARVSGTDTARVQSPFVTVDLERDTDAVVNAYAKGFDARFAGVPFDAGTTARITRDCQGMNEKLPLAGTAFGYTIDNAALSHEFDPQGRSHLALRHDQIAGRLAANLLRPRNEG